LIKADLLEHSSMRKIKMKAIRSGAWFKVLPRIDRVLFDLTIKVTKNIRSYTLSQSILSIIQKIENALQSPLSKAIRNVGLPLAQELSATGKKLGNQLAHNWSSDASFWFFLAVLHINDRRSVAIT
jgi:hypothetical protein